MSLIDGIRIEGELEALSTRHFDGVNLIHVGETCGEEDFALRGMPAGETAATEVAVTVNALSQRNGDLGNSLHYQIFIRRGVVALRDARNNRGGHEQDHSGQQRAGCIYKRTPFEERPRILGLLTGDGQRKKMTQKSERTGLAHIESNDWANACM